jgi:hypothetical protein
VSKFNRSNPDKARRDMCIINVSSLTTCLYGLKDASNDESDRVASDDDKRTMVLVSYLTLYYICNFKDKLNYLLWFSVRQHCILAFLQLFKSLFPGIANQVIPIIKITEV